MTDGRRDPEDFLRRAREEERREGRGKLVVFFGAAPGVGKTYAMLEAARSERDLKRDVIIGVVETHGRYDTGALVIGLPILPRRTIAHRGVTLSELDLDAALARRPGLVLIDELAHTNAPGSRHDKRWQDVEELLDAGIDVYATLNVQHLESLNDVIARITGVVVRETVPDRVLDEATELRLIDLPPDELLERLREGKVYLAEQASRATEGFFRKGNLIALRELALRSVAERVDSQMRVYRAEHGIDRVWAAGERILVAVSPSPTSARLVRATRRLAGTLHATWIAVYVETPAAVELSAASRARLAQNLRLAEQLGAEIVTLSAPRAAEETIRYARDRNVTKIVIGKPTHSRWRDRFTLPFLDEVVRSSGGIDVYVISGDEEDARHATPPPARESHPRRDVASYVIAVGVAALMTCLSWLLFGRRELADVVMVYLLGILLVAMRFGYGPSLLAAVLSVLCVDFFFVPPYLSFSVSDLQHVVTFGVMLVVAVVVSSLTQRLRVQAEGARSRELRTASLYAMTRELAATRATAPLVAVAVKHLHDAFEAKVAVLLPSRSGPLFNLATGDLAFTPDAKDQGVAEWVWRHGKAAGTSTDTLPSAAAIYVPLRGAAGPLGVLAVAPAARDRFLNPEQRSLLDVFASPIASALERSRAPRTRPSRTSEARRARNE